MQHMITLTYKNVASVAKLTGKNPSQLNAMLVAHTEYEVSAGRVKVELPPINNYQEGRINTPVESRYFVMRPKGFRS